jgi:hypothetical protein
MAGIEKFLAKRLKLKVNKVKSAVANPSVRQGAVRLPHRVARRTYCRHART